MHQSQNDPRQAEMTRLGLYGLIPFAFGAIAVWITPLLPDGAGFARTMHSMVLAYSGIITVYLAGVGAGGLVAGPRGVNDALLPNMVVTLIAFLAVWTNLPFHLDIPLAWRHAILFLALIYLLLRDLRAVEAGNLPQWYGPLRIRLTFWASLSILAIISKLILTGNY